MLSGIALHIVILLLHRGEPPPSHVLVQRLLSIVSSCLQIKHSLLYDETLS